MNKTDAIVRRENRMIKSSIILFIIGNVFFLSVSAAIAYYGGVCVYKFFTQWHLQSWEKWSILIGLGGIALFIQILFSFFQKSKMPKGYIEISSSSHPALFGLIKEIQSQLKISKSIRVFLTDKVTVSVFVLPDIKNIVTKPNRFLSIGRPLIENLTEEELRAVLYHEFAHVCQEEINDTARASSIGLFARSFLSERIEYNNKCGPGNLTLFLMVFYYLFLDHLCRFIKRHYEKLVDELEYEADDIAIHNVAPEILCDALIHINRLSGEKTVPVSIKKRIKRMGVRLPSEKKANEINLAKMRIRLANRKHFMPWIDYTYSLLLNGKDIGNGNFIKGFSIDKNIIPDVYTLETSSYISTLDSKPFTFEAVAGFEYNIDLDYKYVFWELKYVVFCQNMNVNKL